MVYKYTYRHTKHKLTHKTNKFSPTQNIVTVTVIRVYMFIHSIHMLFYELNYIDKQEYIRIQYQNHHTYITIYTFL